jgi:hypothetical protein
MKSAILIAEKLNLVKECGSRSYLFVQISKVHGHDNSEVLDLDLYYAVCITVFCLEHLTKKYIKSKLKKFVKCAHTILQCTVGMQYDLFKTGECRGRV